MLSSRMEFAHASSFFGCAPRWPELTTVGGIQETKAIRPPLARPSRDGTASGMMSRGGLDYDHEELLRNEIETLKAENARLREFNTLLQAQRKEHLDIICGPADKLRRPKKKSLRA